MSTITPNLEIRDAIIEEGGADAYKCYQCGKCMSVCPWFLVDTVDFPVYRIPQEVKLGTVTSSEGKEEIAREVEEMFRCLGCEACTNRCPLGVSIPHVVRAVRRMLVEYGAFPPELKSIVSKIYNVGNPYGEPREKRTHWASGHNVPAFQTGTEFLYFSCCLPAYDARGMEVSRATTRLFNEAGLSYGILPDESCCSEAIRRVGAEKVFQHSAKANIDAFGSAGVQKVVTTSPHCYSTFKNEYPELGADFEVVHQTQLLSQLIEEERIVPRKPLEKRVVYHDPCTLGRQNGIYDEPRRILTSIPGLELVEIENFSREFSICCGGGSGGMWLDWPMDQRVSHVRIGQVLHTGADILAVACPYCLQMFEDTIKSEGLDLEVRDVSELLAGAL